MLEIRDYCAKVYADTYIEEKERLVAQTRSRSQNGTISAIKQKDIETAAQKYAIKTTLIRGLGEFPEQAADIWHVVYGSHVRRKSGIDDTEIISQIISAHQSWIKSSGHAFEETIKQLGIEALREHGIEIVLQRDLSILLRANELHNEARDIGWLKDQIGSDVFDLFAIVNRNDRRYCYGVIQSKTSIRDRVTRDREPSMQAMQSFFWSVAITLDGDFLRLPKFTHMVNGGSSDYSQNGWHGMYVFSEVDEQERIFHTDIEFSNFKEHAIAAAEYWLTQRQWFNADWKAKKTKPILYPRSISQEYRYVASDTAGPYKREPTVAGRSGGVICDKCKKEFQFSLTGRENPGHTYMENVDCPYCGNTVCEVMTSRNISIRKIDNDNN